MGCDGRREVGCVSALAPHYHNSGAADWGDSMVNNAGIGGTENHGMVHDMAEQTWDNVMTINSKSVFLGCKYACAQFMKQEPHSSGHRGWIVNTSSIMGLVGQMVYGAAYCASKGAVTLLTKQIAVEYAKHKVHCNAVCPGRELSHTAREGYFVF